MCTTLRNHSAVIRGQITQFSCAAPLPSRYISSVFTAVVPGVKIGWWQQLIAAISKTNNRQKKSVCVFVGSEVQRLRLSIHSFKCFQGVWGSHCPDDSFQNTHIKLCFLSFLAGGCKDDLCHPALQGPHWGLDTSSQPLGPQILKMHHCLQKNSVSKALCLKHLKLGFLKTRAAPKTQ